MPDLTWLDFVSEVEAAVRRHDGVIHTTARGCGQWDGVCEDTAVVLFTSANALGLARDLSLLAIVFEQDAIGVVVGVSTLVLNADADNARRRASGSA